jgi:hypothetical protein
MEKKSIIEEVYEETYELLDDSVDMKIETLREDYDKVPANCPTCGQEFEEIYCRSEKSDRGGVFDLIVLKCPDCHASSSCRAPVDLK